MHELMWKVVRKFTETLFTQRCQFGATSTVSVRWYVLSYQHYHSVSVISRLIVWPVSRGCSLIFPPPQPFSPCCICLETIQILPSLVSSTFQKSLLKHIRVLKPKNNIIDSKTCLVTYFFCSTCTGKIVTNAQNRYKPDIIKTRVKSLVSLCIFPEMFNIHIQSNYIGKDK